MGAPGAGSVVPIYLNAAERWTAGADLYALAWPLDLFRYPPWVAAAFVPLTWVSVKTASLLWLALSAGVFLAGLTLWVRHGLPRWLSPGESGALFVLAAPLVLSSLNNGQTNLILAGFLLLGATDIDDTTFRETLSVIVKHRTDLDLVAERVGVKLAARA